MSTMIGFGVVGTGRMASTMMTAFRHLPGVEVRAVASQDASRAQAFAARHGIPSAFSRLDDLLSHPGIDAVYIANANALHAAASLNSIAAGKAVLCEKPCAISAGEAEAVIAAARKAGQVFLEAMWLTHLPSYRRLLELVQSGAIGKAVHVQADFGYPTLLPPGSSLILGPGSGVLLDRGVYPLSLAIHFFGPAEEIQATVRTNAAGVDIAASLLLRHAGGLQSQLSCSLDSLLSNSATVSGTLGHARILPPLLGGQAVSYRRMQPLDTTRETQSGSALKAKVKQALSRSRLAQRLRPLLEGKTEILSYGASPYLPMLRHFCAMVHRQDQERLHSDQAISLEVLRVIERARSSGSV